jgi:hypothetical protein
VLFAAGDVILTVAPLGAGTTSLPTVTGLGDGLATAAGDGLAAGEGLAAGLDAAAGLAAGLAAAAGDGLEPGATGLPFTAGVGSGVFAGAGVVQPTPSASMAAPRSSVPGRANRHGVDDSRTT